MFVKLWVGGYEVHFKEFVHLTQLEGLDKVCLLFMVVYAVYLDLYRSLRINPSKVCMYSFFNPSNQTMTMRA